MILMLATNKSFFFTEEGLFVDFQIMVRIFPILFLFKILEEHVSYEPFSFINTAFQVSIRDTRVFPIFHHYIIIF